MDQLVGVDRIERSTSVTEFVLERAAGTRLPDWPPGAHIDVVLPSGKIRQYSLCGDRWALTSTALPYSAKTMAPAAQYKSTTKCSLVML